MVTAAGPAAGQVLPPGGGGGVQDPGQPPPDGGGGGGGDPLDFLFGPDDPDEGEEPPPPGPVPRPPAPAAPGVTQPPPATAAEDALGALPAPVTFRGASGRRSLAGGWTYRPDPRDQGLRRGWQRRMPEGRQVTLPYSPNASRVSGSAGARSFAGSVGWYRREIEISRPGRHAIRFESVHHRATVFLDGRRIGGHTGAYLPFELRRTLSTGRHVLTVRVDWRDPKAMKRSGWHRAWFNYGGIHREVTIRRLGESDLGEPRIRTSLTTHAGRQVALVDISVRVRNLGAARTVAATGTLERDGQRIALEMPPVQLERGRSARVSRRLAVPDPVLWSPASPALYDLRLAVEGESGYQARVGLRQLRLRSGKPLLNGAPLFLRGASIHEEAPRRGDAMTPEDMDAIVARLVSLGANGTRAQHPLHPALLERLDAAGIMVWQGIGPFDSPGSWTSTTRKRQKRAHERVLTTLGEAQTHPSIFAWNLANEVAYNGRAGGQARYIDRAARALHARDPGRFVAVDVWGRRFPQRPGLLYRNIDAVGATNYIGWYEAPYASEAEIGRIIARRIEGMRAVFPRKALVATEFGAEANDRNRSDRHGGFEYQARLLAAHLRAYRTLPDVSGMLVWNLTDFPLAPNYAGGSIVSKVPRIRLTPGLNQKGLFTGAGSAKPSVEVVRAEFQAR